MVEAELPYLQDDRLVPKREIDIAQWRVGYNQSQQRGHNKHIAAAHIIFYRFFTGKMDVVFHLTIIFIT